MSTKHIIIGTSAAGMSAATKLRTLDQSSTIICISDEQEVPYNKCFLADFLATRKASEGIFLKKSNFFESHNISLLLNSQVTTIRPDKNYIELSTGQQLIYHTLLLALGAQPKKLFPDIMAHNLVSFYTLADVYKIQQLPTFKKVVIIGAGLSGIECADALRQLHPSIEITLIERQPHILPSCADHRAAELITSYMHRNNITILDNASVNNVKVDNNYIYAVELDKQRIVDADLVVTALGAYPRTSLVHEAGIICTNSSYIKVNDTLQTNYPNIYAAGDVIMAPCQITKKLIPSCTWPDAMMQGGIAAENMVGKTRSYPGIIPLLNSSFFGTSFVSGGLIIEIDYATSFINEDKGFYHRFFVADNRLKGFILVGNTSKLSIIKRLLVTQQPVFSLRDIYQ